MDMQAGCGMRRLRKTPNGKKCLGCVDEKYRVIIILHYVEGFKIREIGEILHESESAVKRRFASAMQNRWSWPMVSGKRRNARMKQSEKIISGLQQDIVLPDIGIAESR